MSKILDLRERAKKDKKRIILPEGEDVRVLTAAVFLTKEGLADIFLLGDRGEIQKLAKKNSITLEGITVVDSLSHEKLAEVVNTYYEIRKHKGITPEDARDAVLDNLVNYAAIMTKMGIVDGFVAGAYYTTSSVARAAIQCFKLDKEIGTVSSSFIIELENCSFGESGLFAYGDCAVIPHPTSRQLVGIAIATSDTYHKLFDVVPRVAMLSYSTKGSAKGSTTDSILAAIAEIKQKRPDLVVDGELQLDAAIVPEIAQIKCPDSDVGGKANVLIFPNLEAGNIAYKLTQRLGKARAVGPILQGLDKPCGDLSRGCSWEDIVDTVVVTAIRAQEAHRD